MARRCTYRDPDTHARCPKAATHAAILALWGSAVWTIYDCTWAPSDHEADFCYGDSITVADVRTRRSEEAAYA